MTRLRRKPRKCPQCGSVKIANIGCNIHYKYNRMITVREGLRFQSFPDSFEIHSFSKRNYYVQVGNAVPPLLSNAWALHIKDILSKK